MDKNEAVKLLDDFYDEIKEAELLAYISCDKRDKKMACIFDKYADIFFNELAMDKKQQITEGFKKEMYNDLHSKVAKEKQGVTVNEN